MDDKGIDIRVGTVNFWIKKGMKYNDGKAADLFNINKKEGNISILKGNNNYLVIKHSLVGVGNTILEYDVSSLSSNAHMFTITWSVEDKEINLYIDAEPVAKTEIEY
ncbi:hypothetical protein ACFLWW_02590 [Chloroflexota bacterium]